MKHNIRQRVINEYGLPVVKVETIQGELGSGIFDKNGKEIFEGDILSNGEQTFPVIFIQGAIVIRFANNNYGGLFDIGAFEVVGHVEDK